MKFIKYLMNPKKIIIKLLTLNIINIPDEKYLKMIFKLTFGRKLDLNNPTSLNEKMQWIKLYDRNPIYTKMVDKYEVKNCLKEIIGEEYIIPTIGIYENFNDIDFSQLPNSFVIKCTHDSGGLVICDDKSKLEIKKIKKIINKSLKRNYYYQWREWPYKDVKPRIIIEKFMGNNLLDYKIQCFNGLVDNILVCEGRGSKRGVRYHYFDKEWNYLDYCPYDDVDPKTFTIEKPKNLEKMLDIATTISENYPEMRVDLYNIDGKVYFGEITFFSDAGFDTTITNAADMLLGSKLKLPTIKR